MIEKWLNSFNYTDKEKQILANPKDCDYILDSQEIDNRLKALLIPYNDIADWHFNFDISATSIIDKLFAKYVDDDTLVITTSSEHSSVRNNLKKCKHVISFINRDTFNDVNLLAEIRKYKKVFVYTIGLSMCDNFILHQSTMNRLKQMIDSESVEAVYVLDAVQEMFMLPRDYSMFDYVISTAHATIANYDLGLCLSKHNIISEDFLSNATCFLRSIELLMSRRNILSTFHYAMKQELYLELMKNRDVLKISNHSPFIFNIEDYTNQLIGINKMSEDIMVPTNYTPATFRACIAVVNPDIFMHNLEKVKMIFE